jgi:hypothetical protein
VVGLEVWGGDGRGGGRGRSCCTSRTLSSTTCPPSSPTAVLSPTSSSRLLPFLTRHHHRIPRVGAVTFAALAGSVDRELGWMPTVQQSLGKQVHAVKISNNPGVSIGGSVPHEGASDVELCLLRCGARDAMVDAAG